MTSPTPSQREQIEQALPGLPEARIESRQTDGAMRTTTLHTYSAFDMREFAIDAVLAAIESLRAQRDAYRDALEEIALAGMSPSPEMSENGVEAWHARQAWRFIGIAARALSPALSATQPQGDKHAS